MNNKEFLYVTEFDTWQKGIDRILDTCKFLDMIPLDKPVLLKPNLVNCDDPPITTPVQLVEAIIDYVQRNAPNLGIAVGEGCGMTEYDTFTPFKKLGFVEMAGKRGVELIDLNTEPTVHLKNPECRRWPEMFLPKIVMESFLVSVPVLKAHSLSDVTLTMKNMVGIAPPKYYNAGSWKKSAFHYNIHEAIFDLNRYRCPDFTILDATIGMAQAHLWGPTCSPPVNKIVAGKDPVAVDAFGCELLGREWNRILHIKLANEILGSAEYKNIKQV